MTKRYILPTVTSDGQDTNISIVVDDDAKLREWLHNAKRHVPVGNFRLHWSTDTNATVFLLMGALSVVHRMDGIYVQLKLCYEDCYRDALYPIGDICRMLFKGERPSFGLCVTVTVQ
jgi:hypothetical protein